MNPADIRAIRGNLTQAAFAKLLGVSKLTVLRWELPPDNKESRRPKPESLDTLHRLASSARAADDEALDRDETRLAPLLAEVRGADWSSAEDALLELQASQTLETAGGRALATIAIAETHLLARGDRRSAFTVLLPVLQQVERGELPPSVEQRAHVAAAVLFSSVDARYFDIGRANAHLARADELTRHATDDDRVMLTYARFVVARLTFPGNAPGVFREHHELLDRASTALTRYLALYMRTSALRSAGETERAAACARELFELAQQHRFLALQQSAFAEQINAVARGTARPEATLAIARAAREASAAARLPCSEHLLIILAHEIDAHCRLGSFAQANAVAEEAMRAAKLAEVPRYAIAMPVANLYVTTGRVSELAALADDLASDKLAHRRGRADLHALVVRAFAATLAEDHRRANELVEEAHSLPDTTAGFHYLARDLNVITAYAKLLVRDADGVAAALSELESTLRRRSSVRHSAILLRLQGYLAMQQGELAEARQKLEASLETFVLIGDVYQQAVSKATLALLAIDAGRPEGKAQLDAGFAEIGRYGPIAPELLRRRLALSVPQRAADWKELSLAERLLVAVDELSVPGVSADPAAALPAILQALFPHHTPAVAAEETDDTDTIAFGLGGAPLRVGVRGRLAPNERAALQYLAVCAPLLLQSTSPSEPPPEDAADAILPSFVAAAEPTRRLKADLVRLSDSSATVLVTGESGAGKEVVARAIHDLSPRANGPYVALNCASVPRELFESQLFGHKRGAFTGATTDSPGVIRAAHGGTLFLDEIGELPLDQQPKLLRFLENNEVLGVGEQQPRRVDVRVVAATHRSMGELVRARRFREDLYYRLNVVPVHVPPLRERREDVVALARTFLARLTPEGETTPDLSRDAVAALMAHPWPGNVRELRNVLERAMAFAPVPRILHADHLRLG